MRKNEVEDPGEMPEYEMGKTLCIAIVLAVLCATAGLVLADLTGVLK
jgi:hypothetical protein